MRISAESCVFGHAVCLKRITVAVLLAFAWADSSAQQVVDGSRTPNLIPDSAAYRMVLLALSNPGQPSEEQIANQKARLAAIGLQEDDRQILLQQLVSFRAEYGSVTRFTNESARDFHKRRGEFVQSVRDRIKMQLSSDGWLRFEQYVWGEKAHMKTVVRLEEMNK